MVWGGSGYGRYPYYPPPPHYRPPPYYPPPGYRPPPPGYRPPGLPPPGALPPGRPTPYPSQWQPDQSRLRKGGSSGVAAGSVATMESRGWGSGRPAPSTQPGLANRPAPATGAIGGRPTPDSSRISSGTVGSRPNAGNTPSFNQPITRPSPSPGNAGAAAGAPRPPTAASPRPVSGRATYPGGALSDLNSGARAQNFSNRGAASHGNNRGSVSSRGNSR